MSGFVETNWRLMLLGITSVVLSIASGWTTLDGMSNFTSAPMLSFLITFGIQSVMLISAWMLGEALVNRFHGSKSDLHAIVIALLFLAVVIASLVVFLTSALPYFKDYATMAPSLSKWAGPVVGLTIVLGAVAVGMRISNSNNPARTLFNTAMLAIMFTACMMTSVFFSFDSLFSTVFPDGERARASEIRAKSESDAVLGDLMSVALETRTLEKARVLDGPAWRTFSAGIDTLRTHIADRVAALRQEVVTLTQNEREATQASLKEEAALVARRDSVRRQDETLKADLKKLTGQRQDLQSAGETLDKQVLATMQLLRDAEARAQEEELGLGQSRVLGRGPVYKTLAADIERTKIELRLQKAKQDILNQQIANIEKSIDALDEQLFKKYVEATTTENALTALNADGGAGSVLARNEGVRAELAEKSAAVGASRAGFEQSVTMASLEELSQTCRDAAEALKRAGGESGSGCSTSDVTLASAPVFAQTAGIEGLAARCSNFAANTVPNGSVEALVSRTRSCLQLAELPSERAETLRRRLDNIERTRDDRAHRFIVTMNAFSDGNKLAYLALAIALGIDGLVFISGLLGAATQSSPFRSLPGASGHTVAGADRIMRSALLPNPAEVARLALSFIQPIPPTSKSLQDMFTHRIDLGDARTRRSPEVRRLINAAAGIGTARALDDAPNVYELRREVVDFLTLHMSANPGRQREAVAKSGWCEEMGESLWKEAPKAIETFGRYLRPMGPDGEFVCRIDLSAVAKNDEADVVKILNAAAIGGGVRPEEGEGRRYRIHRVVVAVVAEIMRKAEGASVAISPPVRAGPSNLPETNAERRAVLEEAIHRSANAARSISQDNMRINSTPATSGATAPTRDNIVAVEAADTQEPPICKAVPQTHPFSLGKDRANVTARQQLRGQPISKPEQASAATPKGPSPDKFEEPAARLKVKIVGDTMQFE